MKRLSCAEKMRQLERHGWSVVRRGKHPIYGKLGVSGTVPVPDHGKKTLADAEEHRASRRTDRGRLVANSKGRGHGSSGGRRRRRRKGGNMATYLLA